MIAVLILSYTITSREFVYYKFRNLLRKGSLV